MSILFQSIIYIKIITLANKSKILRPLLSIPYKLALFYLRSIPNRHKGIKSIYLLGSFARKEHIYGLSDIDFIIICDDNFLDILRDDLPQKLSKYIIFGTRIDITHNIIPVKSLSPKSFIKQKYNLTVGHKIILFGEDYINKVELKAEDFITEIENQLTNLIRNTFRSKLEKVRTQKKAIVHFNTILKNEIFRKYFDTDREKITSFTDILYFIETLKLKSSSYTEITYDEKLIAQSWGINPIDTQDFFDYPIPLKHKEHLFYNKRDSNNYDDFFKTIAIKDIFNISFSTLFKNFMVSCNQGGITVTLKLKAPYVWGENKVDNYFYILLCNHYMQFVENQKETYYLPFFTNKIKDNRILRKIHDKKIILNSRTFQFFDKLITKKQIGNLNNLDYYDSLKSIQKLLLDQYQESHNTVSVCICTKNRAHLLEDVFFSLTKQTIAPEEVIIVDHDSIDNTEEVIQHYAQQLPLKCLKSSLDTINKLRDLAVKNATKDIIAFTDDDVILDPNWIKNIKSAYDSDKHLKIMGGSVYHFPHPSTSSCELFHRYYLGERH